MVYYMDMVDYYGKGWILFKQNSAIIILTILLTIINIIISQVKGDLGIFFGVILLLVFSFSITAVIGMTRKMLSNEIVTLKTGWEIGKKYILRIVLLNIILGVITSLLSFIIIIILILHPHISKEFILGCFIISGSISALTVLFAPQAIIIKEKSIVNAIKQSVKLVWNNKTKALILLLSIILISSIKLIPVIGSILDSILVPILGIYLLIVITLIYIDLTQEKT